MGGSQLAMVRLNGAIFFGAVDHVQSSLQKIDEIEPQKKSVLEKFDAFAKGPRLVTPAE